MFVGGAEYLWGQSQRPERAHAIATLTDPRPDPLAIQWTADCMYHSCRKEDAKTQWHKEYVRPEDAIDGIGCGSLSWRRFLGMMLLGSYKCNKHQWKRPCARHPRDTHGHRGEETLAEGWESGSLIAGPCESVAQSKFIEGGVGGGGGVGPKRTFRFGAVWLV